MAALLETNVFFKGVDSEAVLALAPDYIGSGDIYTTPGTDTIMASIIDLAGGCDLGGEVTTADNGTNESIEVSMEQILA